jgi:hypothetical protein
LKLRAVSSTGDIGEELLKHCIVKEGKDFEDIHYLRGGYGGFSHPPSENKIINELVKAVEKGGVGGAIFMEFIELFFEHHYELVVEYPQVFSEPGGALTYISNED